MTTIAIRDVEVTFPFPPYNIQKDYMAKVIECLDTRQNGILESPTGTGKTLSLLCASLAWLENRKKLIEAEKRKTLLNKLGEGDSSVKPCSAKAPQIIYSSRTHSQLLQAMQEMKRTRYNYMKAYVFGSREQMCIDEEVMEEKCSSMKVNLCRTKVKKNMCSYYGRIEKTKRSPDVCNMNILDMEDIVNLGRAHDFCPYYMARELAKEADVIFMPYNYLLDPRMRKPEEVQNNIIIFDEAHNIEKVCEDVVSVQVKTTDIDTAIEDLGSIIDLLMSDKRLDVDEINFTTSSLITLREMLTKIKVQLDEIQLVPLALEGTVFDGDYIFKILEEAGISDNNGSGVSDLLSHIMEFLASTKLIQRKGYGLEIFENLLFIVFYKRENEYKEKIKESFKVQIDEERAERINHRWYSQVTQKTTERCRVLNFWCFCPGFGMNMLMDQEVHCVILTSGTLAPLKPLISELELKVGVQIENPHIVEGDQVCVKILSKGPDMELLNSNYQNRNNPKYIQSLGLVISNLIRIIPDGVLIFFPSYVIMQKSIQHWQQTGIWDAINGTKPIYVEPKDKMSFNNAMIDYYSKIQDTSCKGAIFMAVCRGKVSEGLDFADVNGRAVLITGLPYPPLKDPKIILKKRYLDFRHSKDREYLKGDEWYSLEATRAINQAIGRVIRHKNDYGAIILLDSRFVNFKVKSNLSLWLRQHIVDMKNFTEIIRNVRSFFQQAEEKSLQMEFDTIMSEDEPSTAQENLVKIHTRKSDSLESPSKRQK